MIMIICLNKCNLLLSSRQIMINSIVLLIPLKVLSFYKLLYPLLKYLHLKWESHKSNDFSDQIIMWYCASRLHSPHNSCINQVLTVLEHFLMNYLSVLLCLFFLESVYSYALQSCVEFQVHFEDIIGVYCCLDSLLLFLWLRLSGCRLLLGKLELFFFNFIFLYLFLLILPVNQHLMLQHCQWNQLSLQFILRQLCNFLNLIICQPLLVIKSHQNNCLGTRHIQMFDYFLWEICLHETGTHLDTPCEASSLVTARVVLFEIGLKSG